MPKVVTCLLMKDSKLLILKRSDKVSTYKGLWGGVAGYIEEHEEPYGTALKEIKEEVDMEKKDVSLVRKCDPFTFTDCHEGKKYEWTIYPFLFKIEKKNKIKIDWEHSKYKWISPLEIGRYDTVPHLKDIVFKVFN
ncbi:MAG: NUDIX domain-containing protein [Euryarchaeota archaeon]|nr:NUDIX domain-containing protein [Euryarchaeota archaeon]